MTWISLVCLLALSSSVFGQNGYGGYGGSQKLLTVMREAPTTRTLTSGYGQPVTEVRTISPSIGFVEEQTFMSNPTPVSNYGGYGSQISARTIEPVPLQPEILTPADILCRGQLPETVIPIDNNRRFVVCLDDGKGTEQSCPKGLLYHTGSLRCERRLGPIDNVCASQPCLNGGQCFPQDSSFVCQCPPGSTGKTCELDSRVCENQRPCGGAPNVHCQSFRWGAALPYVCVFDDDEGYGLNGEQIIRNPCREDGPLALAVSSAGFLICDGERMHIQSCPGGTIWMDGDKACDWDPSQLPAPKVFTKSLGGYGQPSYGGETRVLQPSYGGETRVLQPSYGGETRVLQPSYGGETRVLQPSYGGETRVLQSSYGGEPKLIHEKVIESSYGGEPKFFQPKVIESSYGGEPKLFQPKVIESSYGGEPKLLLQKSLDTSYGGETRVFHPKVIESSYGGETRVFQPKVIESSYGSEVRVLPKQVQSYGSSRLISPKVESSYGSSVVPQQRMIQSGY